MEGEMTMIVDAHTHMEAIIHGVSLDPRRRKMTRLLMWNFELMGFNNPLWRGEPPEWARIVIAMEGQLRISMSSKDNLLRFMDRNGIDRTVVHPIAVSYTHLRAHETVLDLVCRLLLEKKKKTQRKKKKKRTNPLTRYTRATTTRTTCSHRLLMPHSTV